MNISVAVMCFMVLSAEFSLQPFYCIPLDLLKLDVLF